MTGNFVYTQSADLRVILQDKMPVLTMDDPVFQDIMPIDYRNVSTLIWEQRDNYVGLMDARMLDSGFTRIKREGIKTWKVDPGQYGNQKMINEEFLTVGREIGSWGNAIDIRKAQAEDQDHLLSIAISRLKKICWDLLTTGTYSVLGPNNQVFATDTFNMQTFSAMNSWSDHAASTPLADLFQMKLKHRGHSVRFDKSAKLYMNATWINHAIRNTNVADLGGRRTITSSGQIQPMTIGQLNEILFEQNLPMLVEYDEGYMDANNAFQLFIPDGKAVLIGARTTGEPVSQFVFTRNPNNLVDGSDPKTATQWYFDFEWKKNPIRGISTLGFNGGVEVWFPSAIVICSL